MSLKKALINNHGARPLKRAIQKYVEDALAEEIIKSHVQEGDVIAIDLLKDASELSIKIKHQEKPIKT